MNTMAYCMQGIIKGGFVSQITLLYVMLQGDSTLCQLLLCNLGCGVCFEVSLWPIWDEFHME